MKKVIVTTTINHVTNAVNKFQHMQGRDLIVVGDKKPPDNYHLDRGVFLTPAMQESYDKALSDAIG